MIYDYDRDIKSEKLNDYNDGTDGSPDGKNEDFQNKSIDLIHGNQLFKHNIKSLKL